MAESYCGIVCENCEHREALQCPGCKAGPGHHSMGDCTIAHCCYDKDREFCSQCSQFENCSPLRWKKDTAGKRLKKRREEAERAERAARDGRIMSGSTMTLFWVTAANLVGSVALAVGAALGSTAAVIASIGLEAVCALITVICLFCMGKANTRFRTAAIFNILTIAPGVLEQIFTEDPAKTIINLVSTVLSVIVMYNITKGFEEVLEKKDAMLSEKWNLLWSWYIGIPMAMIAAVVMLLIIPWLGSLVLTLAPIAMIVVNIAMVVMLYRTGRFFMDIRKTAKAD